MTALKESWQRQKQQRQQAMRDRQQQVYVTLNQLQQTRQTQTAQQRLERISFHQQLHQQTHDQLATIATDRTMMAQQLALDLHNDHLRRSESVLALRQSLQAQVQTLQAETQTWLKECQEARSHLRQQQVQEFTAYVKQLQEQVQAQLAQLTVERQAITVQIRQTLTQDRSRRQAEVEALFQQFATFRAELKQYCLTLSQLVWGTPDSEAPIAEVAIEAPIAEALIAEAPIVEATLTGKAPDSNAVASIADPWSEPTPQSEDAATVTLPGSEEQIYSYLFEQQGARLTEIDAALDLSRFQIVDTLRSLIKKGLVRQRDRMYYVQE